MELCGTCPPPPEGSDYPSFSFQNRRGICLLLWSWAWAWGFLGILHQPLNFLSLISTSAKKRQGPAIYRASQAWPC